jgi:hypothetical protein
MGLLSSCGAPSPSAFAESQQDSVDVPILPEIVVPIRVHILRSAESLHLTCTCTEAQITAWFARADTIWSQAAIHWDIESFVYEEAANPSEFDRIVALGEDADPTDRYTVVHSVYPLEQRLAPGWNIFFINRMAYGGGVYNPQTQAVLIGEYNPNGAFNTSILAHELGHSLGLPHSQELYNLMAGQQSGIDPNDKIRLNAAQIALARTIAESGDSFAGSS